MATMLRMQFEDAEQQCGLIKEIARDMLDKNRLLQDRVRSLCDEWDSEASPVYRDDFEKISNQIDHVSDLVEELTMSIKHYIADIKQVDGSYAKR